MPRTNLKKVEARFDGPAMYTKLRDHDRALDAAMGTDGVSAPAELVTTGALSLTAGISYLSITGTQVFTLAAGTYIGQEKNIRTTVAAGTPVGSLTGLFQNGGTAVTTIASLGAVDRMVTLVWNGTRWEIPFHSGCTFS